MKMNKNEIIFFIISLLIITLSIFNPKYGPYLLTLFIISSLIYLRLNSDKILNVSKDNPKVKTFNLSIKLTIAVLIFVSSYLIILKYTDISLPKSKIILTGILSLFIILFGNIAPKLPFNRYVGLRTPWTLSNEQTWKKTHRFLGYISFPIAILMFILSIRFNPDLIGAISILSWAIIPSIYSYIEFKSTTKNHN